MVVSPFLLLSSLGLWHSSIQPAQVMPFASGLLLVAGGVAGPSIYLPAYAKKGQGMTALAREDTKAAFRFSQFIMDKDRERKNE